MFGKKKQFHFYTVSSLKILGYWVFWLIWAGIFLGAITSAYAILTGMQTGDIENQLMLSLVSLAVVFSFPPSAYSRIRNARKISVIPGEQTFVIKKFRWRKCSWQPEYSFQYNQIQALAFSGSFTREGCAWVLLRNGTKIWLKSGTDNSRVKIFAQDMAKKAQLPFMQIAVEKDDEQFV